MISLCNIFVLLCSSSCILGNVLFTQCPGGRCDGPPPPPPQYPTPAPVQQYNPDIGQTNVGGYGVNKDPYEEERRARLLSHRGVGLHIMLNPTTMFWAMLFSNGDRQVYEYVKPGLDNIPSTSVWGPRSDVIKSC